MGGQGPKDLSRRLLPSQVHKQEASLEVEQPGLEQVIGCTQ